MLRTAYNVGSIAARRLRTLLAQPVGVLIKSLLYEIMRSDEITSQFWIQQFSEY